MHVKSAVLIIMVTLLLTSPVFADDTSDPMTSAGALYSKSVDLANTGDYREALKVSDQALALNVTSLIPAIQANRAGILVMLGRNEEAVAAADVAINTEGNIPTVRSIAWYNKGNAQKALGRISEARVSYAKAHELDPTLIAPDLPAETIVTTAHSPLPFFIVPGAIASAFICSRYARAS